jgi:hypothetical protein
LDFENSDECTFVVCRVTFRTHKCATQRKLKSGNKGDEMKKLLLLVVTVILVLSVDAQCSICTKTASQLGEGPARGLNAGIIYLMLTPFALIGVIGYRWWKKEKQANS